MNSFRNLVVAVCMAIPPWASYKLLPVDPGVTMIESRSLAAKSEQPIVLPTAEKNSDPNQNALRRELELLKLTVSHLSTEIDALKNQCHSASPYKSPASL